MLELVAYIITFLGASILNIAAGQPFSASQILYINFLVNAPLGIALGMDKETPGLMDRAPRPRDATIMTRGLLTTAGLVGLFMAVCTLALISYGTTHYDSVAIGSSMGLTAFSLLIVASAFQARSVTATALTSETFDNRHLNWTVLAEIVLAVLITQMDVMRRIFGTEQLTGEQWLLALVPAIALFFLWELGKLIARRGAEPGRRTTAAVPAKETGRVVPDAGGPARRPSCGRAGPPLACSLRRGRGGTGLVLVLRRLRPRLDLRYAPGEEQRDHAHERQDRQGRAQAGDLRVLVLGEDVVLDVLRHPGLLQLRLGVGVRDERRAGRRG